jgi:hypothetical protein
MLNKLLDHLTCLLSSVREQFAGTYSSYDVERSLAIFKLRFNDAVGKEGMLISYDMHARYPERYPRPTVRYTGEVDGVRLKLFSITLEGEGGTFPVTFERQLNDDSDPRLPRTVVCNTPKELDAALKRLSRLPKYFRLLTRAVSRRITPRERKLVMQALGNFCVNPLDGECHYTSIYSNNLLRKCSAYRLFVRDVFKVLSDDRQTEIKEFIRQFKYDGKTHTVEYLDGLFTGYEAFCIFSRDMRGDWKPGERDEFIKQRYHFACQS